MKTLQTSLILLTTILLISCNTMKKEADLVIYNATIYTVDDQFTTTTAQAVKDGKIIGLGGDKEMLNSYQAVEMLDAEGKFVYPGFHDAHCQGVFQLTFNFPAQRAGSIERIETICCKFPDNLLIKFQL